MTSLPLLLLSCMAGLASAQELAAPEPPEGFEALFAGQDLYGWIGLAETAALQGEANRLAGDHWRAEGGDPGYINPNPSPCILGTHKVVWPGPTDRLAGRTDRYAKRV